MRRPPTTYVSYVYPGWHRDPYRPDVDEWDLLQTARPYFRAHLPPARPLGGRYDDASTTTVETQIRQAAAHGVTVFDYFCYFADGDFVMNQPLEAAVVAVERTPGFALATTWCIRLPHDRFPVGPVPAVSTGPGVDDGADTSVHDLGGRPIDELSVGDLERFLRTADEEVA